MHITYAENQSLIILDPALGCFMAKNQEPNPPARGPKQVQFYMYHCTMCSCSSLAIKNDGGTQWSSIMMFVSCVTT